MSKQALNERLNDRTVRFLEEVFHRLFEMQAHQAVEGLQLATTTPFSSIRILDATTLTLSTSCIPAYPGTVGAAVKFQLEFDYLTGRFRYIEIQCGKAGDAPAGMDRLLDIRENELFLQDLGYFQFDTLELIDKGKAFYVSRARSDTMFYIDHPTPRYHPDGKIVERSAYERLLLEDEWKTLKRGEIREYPAVYMGKHKKLPTRLVIYRMTKEEQRRQEHRIKRRGQTKPGQIKQKSKDLSSLSILVTNLPSKVPAKEVVRLYRYRWQIELLFRSWKSDLKIDHFREMKRARWECHLYAELIVLIFSTLIAFQLRARLWRDHQFILSEQIAMREIGKKIGVLWHARDGPDLQNTLQEMIPALLILGRKKGKEPGPIGWHN